MKHKEHTEYRSDNIAALVLIMLMAVIILFLGNTGHAQTANHTFLLKKDLEQHQLNTALTTIDDKEGIISGFVGRDYKPLKIR